MHIYTHKYMYIPNEFLYSNNSKMKILNILFIIASNVIQFLGINLVKDVLDLTQKTKNMIERN